MSRDEITRIHVGKNAVGIVGLKEALEELVKGYSDRPKEEIQAALLERLSKRNYIPPGAKGSYEEAFFREFNKHLGRPYEETSQGGPTIKVLGPGCPRCHGLEQTAMEVMAEMGLAAGVEHVTDVKEIAKYGVMGTPALVINDRVMSVGAIPAKDKIKKWLREVQ